MSKLIIKKSDKDCAIDVTHEAAQVYYNNIVNLPKTVSSKLSLHMAREIFAAMVEPAIIEVRRLDRAHQSEPVKGGE